MSSKLKWLCPDKKTEQEQTKALNDHMAAEELHHWDRLSQPLKTERPLWGYIIISVTFLLYGLGCFWMGRIYERAGQPQAAQSTPARIENLNRAIQDTSAQHEYNLVKALVNSINTNTDQHTDEKLHEIKTHPGDNWNIRYNDSILNAWGQFEAEQKQLVPN